jgi:hypothetical protein
MFVEFSTPQSGRLFQPNGNALGYVIGIYKIVLKGQLNLPFQGEGSVMYLLPEALPSG